jgi:hypothetical protein
LRFRGFDQAGCALRSATRILAVGAILVLPPQALALSMNAEIDHLLDFIAASHCTFIRNGVAYGGAQAADHIKDKYEYYREDIRSTEDFIAMAATRSALSGRPYLVQCGGNTMPAADWLKQELATLRKKP